ncbi:MAG TPA: hypothetical protein DCQ06_01135 [Myxococcales bacterium]|nr:hypothetical protein [Myxococcales bacterium]
MRPLLTKATWVVVVVTSASLTYATEKPCLRSDSCDGAAICVAGRCVTHQCDSSSDCGVGQLCDTKRCVQRRCSTHKQCSVDRRCVRGLCSLPTPGSMGPRPLRRTRRFEASLGPSFPAGWMLHLDALVQAKSIGALRTITLGLGGDLARGDFGWRFGISGQPHRLGPMRFWLWSSLYGLSLRKGAASSWSAGLSWATASGLLRDERPQSALWWGAGAGIGWHHGRDDRMRLRLEIGALTLVGGRYPIESDFALIPSISLRYGLAF